VIDYDTGHMGEYNDGNQDLIPQEIEGAPFGYWSNPAYFNAGSTSYVYLSGVAASSGIGDYLKQYNVEQRAAGNSPPQCLPPCCQTEQRHRSPRTVRATALFGPRNGRRAWILKSQEVAIASRL